MNSSEKGHDMGATMITMVSAVDNLILTHRGQFVENKGRARVNNYHLKKLKII